MQSSIWQHPLETGGTSKTDEFLEEFQAPFDPPPLIFEKSYGNFFYFMQKKNFKNLQHEILP